MPRPQPYETYQGVQVFLYQVVGMQPDEWGASIKCSRRLIDVEMEVGERPTLENMLAAAHRLIDQLKQVEASSLAGPDSDLND